MLQALCIHYDNLNFNDDNWLYFLSRPCLSSPLFSSLIFSYVLLLILLHLSFSFSLLSSLPLLFLILLHLFFSFSLLSSQLFFFPSQQICFSIFVPLMIISILKQNITATPERKKRISFKMWQICASLTPFAALVIGKNISNSFFLPFCLSFFVSFFLCFFLSVFLSFFLFFCLSVFLSFCTNLIGFFQFVFCFKFLPTSFCFILLRSSLSLFLHSSLLPPLQLSRLVLFPPLTRPLSSSPLFSSTFLSY